ncbi:GtrA family protein [Patescibacteria group bacterium]|nr:GtrA family protein [Patescibacteria group bacterium]MBU1877001.1 GtrA family protein [Patescibacteria group bacterium]
MKKRDFIASIIIGEVCGLIIFFIAGPLIPLSFKKFTNLFPIILPILSVLGVWFISLFETKMPVIFQAGKSFLVGILNTFIDLGILTILMEKFQIFVGLYYVLFKATSFAVATLNSYFWNRTWTFEKKGSGTNLKETSKFYLITAGGFLINLAVSSFFVNFLGPMFGITAKLWAYVGAIAAVFLGFIWNFVGYKFIVFKKESD